MDINVSAMSKKIRKKKQKKKKNKTVAVAPEEIAQLNVAIATEENDKLNSNMICEIQNSVAEAGMDNNISTGSKKTRKKRQRRKKNKAAVGAEENDKSKVAVGPEENGQLKVAVAAEENGQLKVAVTAEENDQLKIAVAPEENDQLTVAVAPEENDKLSSNMICEFENSVEGMDSNISTESNKNRKRKQKRKKKKKLASEENDKLKVAVAPEENDKLNSNMICEYENSVAEDRPKDLQIPSIGKSVQCLKKKLLVLDVNGLLADIVAYPFPTDIKRDTMISNKALFKRPFYKEFLNFCFEKFDVAVWSSRLERNVNNIVHFLLGDMSRRLIFCWNASQCTTTNIASLENNDKNLVFKDLRKIWDKYDPNLPWEKGYYNESNTLLLDDSPYKALLNPPYNSVFPPSFDCRNKQDKSLAAGGGLRKYLEGLANAEDVPKYVEQHPFGQQRITEKSKSWDFYRGVLSTLQPKK